MATHAKPIHTFVPPISTILSMRCDSYESGRGGSNDFQRKCPDPRMYCLRYGARIGHEAAAHRNRNRDQSGRTRIRDSVPAKTRS